LRYFIGIFLIFYVEEQHFKYSVKYVQHHEHC
jgi:hypothetical protein